MADFLTMSWSTDFSHSFGMTSDAQCLDDINEWQSHQGTYELDPQEIQVWVYQPGKELKR